MALVIRCACPAGGRIMQIHSRKMNVSKDINFEELARCTDDFNCAQLKAVCVEAGMLALRRGASELVCSMQCQPCRVYDCAFTDVGCCVIVSFRPYRVTRSHAYGDLLMSACLQQHEDYMEGIQQVQSKKKASLAYYA
jgi:SpoVK/Ycf46/Vps4 family AAA+-type ATPase